MKVATWNVNSFRAHAQQVLAWLEREDPDVVALQETMCSERELRSAGLSQLGYEVVGHGDGGRGGVALCSKLGLADVHRGVAGAAGPFAEPRLLSATIEGIRVHSIYAPNGRKVATAAHAYKLAWFQFLTSVLEAEGVPDRETLLLGDLNIAPTDADVWEPARYRHRNLTSPTERKAFAKLLAVGLHDIVRNHHGSAPCFTWWNRRGDFYASDRGWRLDHVLATSTLADGVRDVFVDRRVRGESGGSDHAPIVADIRLPPA
jgi:exodeoxyribonuclease III